MAAPLSPFIADEQEMALTFDLLRRGHLGRISWSPALVDALTRAAFPFACEFWAALAPMERIGDGWIRLDVPVSAQCWPAGAEATADRRFAPGEVRIEALTGRWHDANGFGSGFAYVGAAARVWRRPGDPCGPEEAARRVLAAFGAAVLLQRAAARGYPTTGPEGLPFVPDAPPLAPDAPCEEPQPEASHSTAGPAEPAREVNANDAEPVAAVPVALLRGFAANGDALAFLMDQPVVAAVVEALRAKPADIASAARAMSALAGDAIAGRWRAPTAEPARPAEVVHLTRARRQRGGHLRAAPAAAVATAAGLRATATTMLDLARAASDPVRAAEMRAAGLRPDLLADCERLATRLMADADRIAAALAAAPNDTPPAA